MVSEAPPGRPVRRPVSIVDLWRARLDVLEGEARQIKAQLDALPPLELGTRRALLLEGRGIGREHEAIEGLIADLERGLVTPAEAAVLVSAVRVRERPETHFREGLQLVKELSRW
jgi:hypothetical protein